MNKPGSLRRVTPFDTLTHDGYTIETAFLDFTDNFGRPMSVYAARCIPPADAKLPLIVHQPGGGQTVASADLAFLARQGFAAASFDWQIGAFDHDPKRKTRWPEGVKNQGEAITREEDAVIPLAVQACGVVIDWMAKDKRVDAKRVGVVGISWGGYLTWAVNAHEPRIKAAVPVYGCGGLWEPGRPSHTQVTGAARERWQKDFDALGIADRQIGPVCWISSTNDFFGYHTTANSLLDSLSVDHRRSCDPNNNHHVSQGDSILAMAWFKHYLAGGPPVPREPVLRDDLTIDADESESIAERTLWWTASENIPDDYRCWVHGRPAQRDDMRQAFGRVRYQSGLTLNTPLRVFEKGATPQQKLGDTWPDARDGVCSHWGMRSTQLHRTDIAVSALPEDRSRALWVVDRRGEGPVALSFRGLADPRWNDGAFDAVEIHFDWLGQTAKSLNLAAEFVMPTGGRHAASMPVTVEPGATCARIVFRPTDLPNCPAGAGWADLKKIIITGQIGTNRFVLGPIRKSRKG